MSWRVRVILLVWTLPPRLALADPTPQDRTAARFLFEEGRRLAHEGKYPDACSKFAASQQLEAGMGTLFNLADCYEHVGRTASAWSNFLEVADAAKRAGLVERETVARGRAAALAPRLSHLRFECADACSGVQIRLDGSVLVEGALGAGIPVDPGKHAIEAVGPGKKPWTLEVDVSEKASTAVTVPALEDVPVPPQPPPPPPQRVRPAPPPPPPPAPLRTWQRPLGIVLAGVGLVGAGIGTYLGLRARSQWSDAEGGCASDGCSAPGYASWQEAKDSAKASTIAFSAGGALLAAGVVLWISAPSSSTPLGVGVRINRVTLTGEF
jgi:hypothetical protein